MTVCFPFQQDKRRRVSANHSQVLQSLALSGQWVTGMFSKGSTRVSDPGCKEDRVRIWWCPGNLPLPFPYLHLHPPQTYVGNRSIAIADVS